MGDLIGMDVELLRQFGERFSPSWRPKPPRAPGGDEFVDRFFDEVVAVATAHGHAPSEAFLAQTRALLTADGSTFTSSMSRDLKNNSPIEADQIIGDLLTRGKQAHVHTPLLAAAYTHLAIYQHLRQPRS